MELQPIQLATDREPWRRQPEEPDMPWGCFLLYRDLSPAVRTLSGAYAKYMNERGDKDANPDALYAPAWFETMAKKWQWEDRVREMDEWLDEERVRRLRARRLASLEQVADLGEAMRKKAMEALLHLHAIMYEEIIDENGHVVTVEKSALSPSAIASMAKHGTDLERYALGMEAAGSQQSVTVNVGVGSGNANQLPVPGDDETIIARVVEIAHSRAQLAGQLDRLPSANPKATRNRAAASTATPAPGKGG